MEVGMKVVGDVFELARELDSVEPGLDWRRTPRAVVNLRRRWKRAIERRPAEAWLRLAEALPVEPAARDKALCLVWWDWFGDRLVGDVTVLGTWRIEERCARGVMARREDVVNALMGLGYSRRLAVRRTGGAGAPAAGAAAGTERGGDAR
jgi:hypothetical protein